MAQGMRIAGIPRVGVCFFCASLLVRSQPRRGSGADRIRGDSFGRLNRRHHASVLDASLDLVAPGFLGAVKRSIGASKYIVSARIACFQFGNANANG